MDIQEFKDIIAQNIYYLRTENHMTQYELGEKLNYSDKAISKWERGDGMPDAYVLKKISEIFGVTVDYILTPHSGQSKKIETQPNKKTKRIVNNIVSAGIITVALLLFVIFAIKWDNYYWKVFIYALPAVCVARIVFASIWERAKGVFIYSSIFLWTLLATIYFAIGNYNLWILFVLGAPLQIIVFLVLRMKITIIFSRKAKKEMPIIIKKNDKNKTE